MIVCKNFFCLSLVKHQKFSKCDESDRLRKLPFLFMFLLTDPMLKTVIYRLKITLFFVRNCPKKTWKTFNTKFWPKWKHRESSYQVRHILGRFWNLIALILGLNYVKGIRVTKIFREISFQGVLGKLQEKIVYGGNHSFTGYVRLTLIFVWNSALREKFNFCFSRYFS